MKDKKKNGSYPKGVRIAALAGVALLLLLYGVTLVAGLTTSSASPELFTACLGASILLPILLWCYIFLAKAWTQKNQKMTGEDDDV